MKALLSLFLVQLWLGSRSVNGSTQRNELALGFRGSEMEYIDNYGLFLLSNRSTFAFGFTTLSNDSTAFLLSVVHQGSRAAVWAANRAAPVSNSDVFVFDVDGNAYLQSGDGVIWSTNTSGKGATRIELLDSGNLVLLGDDGGPIWQSFDHPTDTLLSGQSFAEGMSLASNPNGQGLKYRLRIESGDANLFAQFQSPQPYWSMSRDPRKIENEVGRGIHSAVLDSNSWNFYDNNQTLIWKFIVNPDSSGNDTLAAVLDRSGFILFSSLPSSGQGNSFPVRVPNDSCDTPEQCNPYFICSSGGSCQCPTVLSSSPNCNPGIASPCDPTTSMDLVKVDAGVGYFATDFVSPSLNSNLSGCKDACLNNCSCVALFHEESSGNCFLFDQIGSLKQIQGNSSSSTYIKAQSNADGGNGLNGEGRSGSTTLIIIIIISILTVCVIVALIYLAFRIRHRRKKISEPSQGSSEEDNFFGSISGMPVRFSFRELQEATNGFSVKLGEGGFGSVYLGKLPDNTSVAVKKLEGIGQGKKEFRSEVTIIGSIHHIHLVKLRGFCAEGAHRLLAYEYMAKGSLDRWIFKKDEEDEFTLDWDKRYSIALATAKGLAYLHEDCESRIIHCDIKPENVLLDDNFLAKVSDFGLAKLMTREQSHVFTTLRGTRGYLAPEWITNYAISEKSDVYSYGMVLLEIIGGRKNYDPAEISEKAHFPSYAFKKMEEGKLMEVLDAKLRRYKDDKDERIETAIKVALWCIQEDLYSRPSMTKVVQMLEGLHEVPPPPISSQLGFRLHANAFKSISEEGTYSGSGPSDCNSDAFLSAVRLSGPR
ncbi:G-type lectin S-receptor-like serine/threonine-protein kinase SD2-5 [Curcuma longa]|uniref:G-type lectin S-receptor-like serine/threonine-protein kinase SD2-5 n=1 Tax=Curcuma longa TaxID=136217 RepID=UPI003D9F0026